MASRPTGIPSSTRQARRGKTAASLKRGSASKKEAQDAEAARRIEEQHAFNLQKAAPAEVPGTLAGLLKEFFVQHGEDPQALEMAEYLNPYLLAMQIPAIKPLHLSREWNRLLTSGGKGRKEGKPLSCKTVRNIAGRRIERLYARLTLGHRRGQPRRGLRAAHSQEEGERHVTVEQQEHVIAAATSSVAVLTGMSAPRLMTDWMHARRSSISACGPIRAMTASG